MNATHTQFVPPRRRGVIGLAAAAAVAVLGLGVVATPAVLGNEEASASSSSTTPAKGTPAAKAPAAQPGTIAGVVSDRNGNVIPDATVAVIVAGRTTTDGARTDFKLNPDEAGAYAGDMPDGVYKVWATVDVDYNGRRFLLPLHPADNKDQHAPHASAKGVVKNFTWRISGLKPGQRRGEYGAHYGGGILVNDGDQSFDPSAKLAGKYPGATVRVRLEPKGPLMDGSEGKVVTLETPTASLDIRDPKCKHLDVPLGDYTATATLVTANGRERPLQVSLNPRPQVRKPGTDWARSAAIEFAQSENHDMPAIQMLVRE